MDSMAIRFVDIDESNWKAACALQVRPDQSPFVCHFEPVAAEALAAAYVRPGGLAWVPFGICSGDSMVGFFLLCEAADSDEQWLRFFFIDRENQGKGFARKALEGLGNFATSRFPGTRRIKLIVHPDNQRAMDVYQAAGFALTEELYSGYPVWVFEIEPRLQPIPYL